jgi:hypothetical protein
VQASAKEFFDGSLINFYVINPPAMKSRMRLKAMKLLKQRVKNKPAKNPEEIAKQIIKRATI